VLSSPFDLLRRALPAAPDGYTPARVPCPNPAPSVRKPVDLGPDEASWLRKRRAKTLGPMRDFLNRAGIDGFDAGAYVDRHAEDVGQLPNIGIAVSGGGYRAMLNGAGALAAFDARTEGATAKGHLGGLLQSASYVSALSGGGWLVGSMWVNNFSS
jgi:lysophospholipase